MLYGVLFVFLCSVNSILSVNILFLSPVPSPSHHIWNRALAFGLVDKGHNVTFLGPDVDSVPKPKNYHFILLEGFYDDFHDHYEMTDMQDMSPYTMINQFYEMTDFTLKKLLNCKGLQTILDYPKDFKFDLIVYDITIGYGFYPLIHRFNSPVTVGITAFLLPQYVSYDFGNSLHPSYLPWFALPYSDQMSFLERLQNLFYTYLDVYLRIRSEHPKEEAIVKKRFGDNIPSLEEVVRHINLVLVNTDPLLDYPQPLPPNLIPVGGLHTRKPKEIVAEYKDILDKAKDGAIIFSLGTNVRSDKLSDSQKNALLGAFGKLKQTVIWKFESDSLEGLPKNVFIRKWLPQNDVLSHPNVKLFIGHGGALSTQEAIYHGVPMILMPFILDQHINAKRIVDKKLGLNTDIRQITADSLYSQIREILDNPIYRNNMKLTSERYNDRLETPLERGIFWIEYALRHEGADFLNTRARDLPWYAAGEIDTVGFLLFSSIAIVWIIFKVLKIVYCLVCPAKKMKHKVN